MEIKPCPFCGGDASVSEYLRAPGELLFWVECHTETCFMFNTWRDHPKYRTPEIAAEKWNHRAEGPNG